MAAREYGGELDKMNLAEDIFIDGRGSYPTPLTPTYVSVYEEKDFPIIVQSIPWILPLARGSKVKEAPVVDDKIVEDLIDYYIAAGKLSSELDKIKIVKDIFIEG